MICSNITVTDGKLFFAGQETTALAKQYKTPLYLLDEDRIREKCRQYKEAFESCFPEGSKVLYASKANSFKRIYAIMKEVGLGADCVSSGEIYTAMQAGFEMSQVFYHGNNKTDEDIRYAMQCGVGVIVTESCEEIESVDRMAEEAGIVQNIFIRVTPGIDTHTYEAVNTGKVDSKFGSPVETGQAAEAVRFADGLKNVKLMGVHCHVGSMVFAEDVYERTADIMLRFMHEMKEKDGICIPCLNLGGGYGVRYVAQDGNIDIKEKTAQVAAAMQKICAELSMEMPIVYMEPGRSIVADAGMTLYTVGSVKQIPGYKNYVSIDGGMTDNPRYALYRSAYTVLDASSPEERCDMACDLVGRCCESGDIIQPGISLPSGIKRGDIVAVCTTGAYNYSMASNYNRFARPPIVMLSQGTSYVAVRRETPKDITACDM